jgi:hypothetical protein
VGTLSGVVRDQSGAVIPGAAVTVTKTDTGVTLTTKSTATGFYEFQGLIPGPYLLTVQSAGMQKFEGKLIMQVAQRAAVDVNMQVGTATQTVTVKDVTPEVQTTNGTMDYMLEQTRIQQLPLNGRQLTTLLETIPGMEGTRSFGVEDHSYSFFLDGADIADRFGWFEITQRQPGLDSIQEFAVVENASSAKYARPVNIVATTKSGTNQFHGSAFETNRNNDVGYARNRQTYAASAPYLNRNEYGASAGGPLYIPKLYNGKDKTFWYFAWEGLHQVSPFTALFPTPTQAWRQGNLAGDTDPYGNALTMYDPYSTGCTNPNGCSDPATWGRTAYNNNQITEAESPLAAYLLKYQPLPNISGVNPNVQPNWSGPVPNWIKDYTLSARVDQKIGQKDQFYGRYTRGAYTSLKQFYTLPSTDWTKIPAGTYGYNSPNYSVALNWTHTFSPTFFNEVLVSGNFETLFNGTGNLSTDYDAALGLPNPFGVGGWPGIYSAGFPGVGSEGLSWETQNTTANHQFYTIVDDNGTKIQGKHELQFGFHFRDDRLNILPQQQQVAGSDVFDNLPTGLYDSTSDPSNPLQASYTGDNFASFYLGLPSYLSNQLVRGMFYGREKEWSLYFQDNFKVTPRLTVNMGLRWEYFPPYTEKNNMIVAFDPSYGSNLSTTQNVGTDANGNPIYQALSEHGALVLASSIAQMERFGYTTPSIVAREQQLGVNFESAGAAGYPSRLQTGNPDNFGPHIGFAYKLTQGDKPFVLRGGYALSYFHIQLDSWAARMRMNTPMNNRYYWSNEDPSTSPDGIANIGLRTIPTGIAGSSGATSVVDYVNTTNANSINPSSSFMDYFALNQPTPRVHTWNLTLQKEIPWKMVLSASYVGNHSYGNETLYNYNQATPAYIWYTTTGLELPLGTYSGTARNFFNQTMGSTIEEWLNSGWGNSNGAEIQLKRTFQSGSTFQFFYTLDNNFAAGGQGYSGASQIPSANLFAPGTVPTLIPPPSSLTGKLRAMEQEYDYQRDTSIPKNRYTWNFVQDLPFGKGKHFLNNTNKIVDKFIGGWQISGLGTAYKPYTTVPSNYFPTGTPIQQYGYKYPIKNCTSGTCYPGYLMYNGYIPANQINTPNGYEGLPANYKPAFQPLIPYGATSAPNAPAGTDFSNYYNSNTVWVPLNDGTVQRTTWAGFNPLWHEYLPTDWQWDQDASLVKNIPFKEHYNFRLQCDFFNVFNHPGNPNSFYGVTGVLNTQTSGISPRVLQLVGRFSW